VAAAGVTDTAGNANAQADGPTVTIDRTAPTATIALQAGSDSGTSNSDDVTNASSLVFNVTFSESVTGLAVGNFTNTGTATGCTFGSLTGSGASYTITASGCPAGTVVVRLAANAVSDTAGNQNALTNGSTVTIDRTAPTLVSVVAADGGSQNDPGEIDHDNKDDTLKFTYSENISAGSISTGNVSVTFTNNDATCAGSADSITVPGVGKVCLGSQAWLNSSSTTIESLSVSGAVATLAITTTPPGAASGAAASNFNWSAAGGTAADTAGNVATGSVTTNSQTF
jgi:hypothetical protein